jgi:hypothetical protein
MSVVQMNGAGAGWLAGWLESKVPSTSQWRANERGSPSASSQPGSIRHLQRSYINNLAPRNILLPSSYPFLLHQVINLSGHL